MSKIRAVCSSHSPLLAELSRAEFELAEACEEGGADALIVPLRGEYFTTLEYDLEVIREVISKSSIPVGVYLGSLVKELEWEAILGSGVDFVSAFPNDLPPFAAFDGRVDKLLYVPSGLSIEVYRSLSLVEGVISLVYVPLSQMSRDRPFNLLDVINLEIIARFSFKPVMFKVSRDVRPDDVQSLLKRGCSGIVVSLLMEEDAGPEAHREVVSKYKSALRARPGYSRLPSWG